LGNRRRARTPQNANGFYELPELIDYGDCIDMHQCKWQVPEEGLGREPHKTVESSFIDQSKARSSECV